jgi:hypothetical protein
VPGVAETLDWATALSGLHADHLDEALVNETLGCVLKDADDMKRFRAEVNKSGLAPFLQQAASVAALAQSRPSSLRRASPPQLAADHAAADARMPCARSTISTSATATSSRAVCAWCSSRAPRRRPSSIAASRPSGGARSEADAVAEALAGPGVPEPGDGPGLESQGARSERLALEGWGEEGQEEETGEPLGVPAASELDAVATRDFSTFSADQLDELLRITVQIARRLARRVSRRRRPVRPPRARGPAPHAAREPHAGRDHRAALPPAQAAQGRLVLLCDVSGSMDLYSRFLLQFLFALQHVFSRVETFTFSVRLTHVSESCARAPIARCCAGCRRCATGRGAPIGESLAEFNRYWAHLVDRRTIVIVLSDGWDTGDPEVLATELLRIKRRAGRVIWLNPLLGNPPTSR